jgi:hypothetical protein
MRAPAQTAAAAALETFRKSLRVECVIESPRIHFTLLEHNFFRKGRGATHPAIRLNVLPSATVTP